MILINNFFIKLFCKLKYTDAFGNQYYIFDKCGKKQKRFVVYRNDYDPAGLNPVYHAWLHHLVDDISEISNKKIDKNRRSMVELLKIGKINHQGREYHYWVPIN
jgi:NADH:ubiquinone oxidoreductase subunit